MCSVCVYSHYKGGHMKTLTPCNNKQAIRKHLENKISMFYGDDSVMLERYATASDYDVELEYKRVFNINSKVSYFGA